MHAHRRWRAGSDTSRQHCLLGDAESALCRIVDLFGEVGVVAELVYADEDGGPWRAYRSSTGQPSSSASTMARLLIGKPLRQPSSST